MTSRQSSIHKRTICLYSCSSGGWWMKILVESMKLPSLYTPPYDDPIIAVPASHLTAPPQTFACLAEAYRKLLRRLIQEVEQEGGNTGPLCVSLQHGVSQSRRPCCRASSPPPPSDRPQRRSFRWTKVMLGMLPFPWARRYANERTSPPAPCWNE